MSVKYSCELGKGKAPAKLVALELLSRLVLGFV